MFTRNGVSVPGIGSGAGRVILKWFVSCAYDDLEVSIVFFTLP
jgi:hypothetical protein